MATIVAAPRARINSDRMFFTGMAAALVLVTFIGFAPTYFLRTAFHGPELTPLVHLHGIVFSAWMLLFLAQTGLISARQTAVHRIVGMGSAALAVAVLILGIVVAIRAGHLGSGPPDRNQPAFLVNPFANILLFAGFCAYGIARRNRAQDHKRLMLLATMSLAVTPLARIGRMLHMPFNPVAISGMMLADIFLVALIAFDLTKRGKLHPVTLWAGGIFFVTQPLRIMLGNTEIWQDFARMLIA